MTDIASRTDMGLTALYRYFPNKRALLRELAVRLLAQDRSGLLNELLQLDVPVDELLEIASRHYVQLHREERYRLALRTAMQAEAALAAFDLADSRANASRLAARVSELTAVPDMAALERFILLHLTLLDLTVQLMFRLDDEPERAALLAAFVVASRRQFRHLLQQPNVDDRW